MIEAYFSTIMLVTVPLCALLSTNTPLNRSWRLLLRPWMTCWLKLLWLEGGCKEKAKMTPLLNPYVAGNPIGARPTSLLMES